MFRQILKYGVILGSLAFLLQLLQHELGLSYSRYYFILIVIAVIFVVLGFMLGNTWQDATSRQFRKNTFYTRLTDREREVAELILQGLSNKEIQDRLFVEKSTLKTHINQIYKKGEINDRREFKKFFGPDESQQMA